MMFRTPQWRFFAWQTVLNGGIFALLMTLFDLAAGNAILFWKVLFYFFFFGLLMAYFYLSQTRAELRRMGLSPDSPEAWKTRHHRTFTSAVPPETFRRLLEAEKWVRKVREQGEGWRVTTRPTARSWGERMEIAVKPLADGAYRYEVSTRPLFGWLTLVDFGKNLENLQRMEALLQMPEGQPT